MQIVIQSGKNDYCIAYPHGRDSDNFLTLKEFDTVAAKDGEIKPIERSKSIICFPKTCFLLILLSECFLLIFFICCFKSIFSHIDAC